MATPFTRTLRSLRAENQRARWVVLALCAILGGWTLWLFFARVSVYEVTDAARTELDGVVHPLEAQASGMVTRSRLLLGAEVKAGDVLVELDTRPQALQLGE